MVVVQNQDPKLWIRKNIKTYQTDILEKRRVKRRTGKRTPERDQHLQESPASQLQNTFSDLNDLIGDLGLTRLRETLTSRLKELVG